jgi:hypothetical protein
MPISKRKPKEVPNRSITQDVAARIGHVVGIDSEHCVHAYYPAADTVKVYGVDSDYAVGDYIDKETCEHTEELDGRPLSHWMCYVREFRGEWIETTHRAPAFGGSQ